MRDRVKIFDHIEASSPQNAIKVDNKILQAAAYLAAFPQIGRASRREGIREWVIAGTGFLMIYRVHQQVVQIIAVIRATRDPQLRPGKL